MRQERQQELEALKEALKNFIVATEELNRSYTALKKEVERLNTELQKQKNLLRAIVESLRDGVVAVDLSGNVVASNRNAFNMLGIKEGQNLSPLLRNLQREMEVYTLEGERKVLKIDRFPLMQDSRTIGEVVILRDITRERELEEEGKRKERLSAMGRMAASIAHEIRNPLGSIELFAGLIKRGGTQEEQQRWAESIIRVVKSINNLISNMLIFTRPIYVEPAPFNVKELLKECLEAASSAIREKGIEVVLEGEEAEVWADRELMKQAILNLVINAIQAMDNGGRLTLKAIVNEGECIIQVGDTGCGIPPEAQKRIFDPFYTTKKKGTGLGLAIVHRIVEAHRGRITVSSSPGNTTFTIRIPVNTDAQVH